MRFSNVPSYFYGKTFETISFTYLEFDWTSEPWYIRLISYFLDSNRCMFVKNS